MKFYACCAQSIRIVINFVKLNLIQSTHSAIRLKTTSKYEINAAVTVNDWQESKQRWFRARSVFSQQCFRFSHISTESQPTDRSDCLTWNLSKIYVIYEQTPSGFLFPMIASLKPFELRQIKPSHLDWFNARPPRLPDLRSQLRTVVLIMSNVN